ncbi:MAG TPA: nuclear transport factor 2 family protein, partial [Gemmatimonadales bacterium]|nr:nuclear transport factor 2 family protein [Gemmatimonadales bacterium]
MTAHPFTAAIVLSTLACTRAPHASVRDELIAVDRAFDSVVAEKGVEGWVSFFADSGIQMPEGSGNVIGHDAIRRHMSGFFSDTNQKLRWVPDKADASSDGTLGYTIGHWILTVRDSTGQHEAYRGKYLTVWRRQADGSWKAE